MQQILEDKYCTSLGFPWELQVGANAIAIFNIHWIEFL